MTASDRLGVTARTFFLAAVLGLALAFQDPNAMQGTLLLVALGALATLAATFSFVPGRWISVVEGMVAALAIGLALPTGAILLPYLLVPALMVGMTAGVTTIVIVVGVEVIALVAALVLGGAVVGGLELAAPWALAGLGTGLTAHWVTQIRGHGAATGDEASYESARRLLSQLRTVARRLSSGLDPVSMASQVLVSTNIALDDAQSALFVRTEGGLLAPLGYRGTLAQQTILPEGPLLDRAWAEMEPAHEHRPAGRAETRHRTVLPLRSGTRMIGVVVSDAAGPPDPEILRLLMRDLDEQSLRLDTALVFDEVRALATTEERQRLAREIHDGVAQEIASLGYYVDELSATAASEAQRAKLTGLRSEISRVVSELRLSIFDLRSEISPAAGLGSALSDYVRTVGARSGLTVHITLDEGPTRLRGEVETELLRIAQEAVTNARKHSHAENLWVDCRVQPPFAQILVRDDGMGLGDSRDDSYGLKIMRERARRIDAEIVVDDISFEDGGPGTRVAVTVGTEELARLDGSETYR